MPVFNRYLHRGGEDRVFEQEAALLRSRGCDVHPVAIDMREPAGWAEKVTMARDALWSSASYRRFRKLLATERPHAVHVHNFFPLVSPAIYQACADAGTPVVQTLHNYRFVCPNGQLYREHRPCEECLATTLPWPGVVHGCYQGSRSKTAVVAAMLGIHNLRRTWHRLVDVFVALTPFARQKVVDGGLPADKVVVKPNFISPDPGTGEGGGRFALFVGRLSENKGLITLLEAWKRIGDRLPLKIAGDGPLRGRVQAAASTPHGIEWLGSQPTEGVLRLMGDASLLVFPSQWYEGMPMTILESYAKGTPVLACPLGAMASMIKPGRTGWFFRAGDAFSLTHRVEDVLSRPEALRRTRHSTRQEYEREYTAEANYPQLLGVYRRAMALRGRALPQPLAEPEVSVGVA